LLRRLIPTLILAGAAATVAAPTFAANHVVYQKNNKLASGFPVLVGLASGHSYRVDVISVAKRSFTVNGYQNYSYIANKGLFEKSAGVTKRGTTPGSFTIKQPRSGKLSQWILGLQVQLSKGRGLTVRVIDLGTGH
jgi:hypothetical protein